MPSGKLAPQLASAFTAAVLALLFLLPAGEARAANECGTWSTSATSHTCMDGAQASGIEYSNIGGDIMVTVTGGAATTINAQAGRGWNAVGAVVVTAAAGTGSRDITLNVGTGSNAVVISEHSTASNSGILVYQYGAGADDATVTLGSGVRIGTSAAPMRKFGVWALTTADANTGTVTITTAATIHSTEFGIVLDHRGAGSSAITNSGSITTSATGGSANDKSGIKIIDWSGSFGADRTTSTTTTVTNSGTITVSAEQADGIDIDADGLGLYKVVNSGTVSTSGNDGHGIRVDADDHKGAAGSTAVEVESSGSITTSGTAAYGINIFENKTDDASIVRAGNIRITTTGGAITTAGANAHGIHLQTRRGHATDAAMAPGDATIANAATVTTEGANADGLRLDNQTRGVTIAAGVTTAYTRSGDATITNSGAITAGRHGIRLIQSGTGNITVTNSGAITAPNEGAYGIHVGSGSTGTIAVTNTAVIAAGADALHVGKHPERSGGITVTNRGALTAGSYGIVVWYGGEGDVRIVNSGAIAPARNASQGRSGIYADEGGAGDIVIENGASVTGTEHGIFARNTEGGGGTVTVTHSAGEVHGRRGSGIIALMGRWRNEEGADSPAPNSTADVRVEVTGGRVVASRTHDRVAVHAENNEGGSIVVEVSDGAELMASHNVGIFAYMSDRQNTSGRIEVDQAGAIEARGGVYASVTRASAAGETRTRPLIDIDWTGSFEQVEATRGSWNNVAHAVEGAQEGQGRAVIRGAKTGAGIDAEVMSWRVLNRIATRGDDPGEIADAAAQMNLLSETHADSRRETILARFRTVLTAGTGTIPGAMGTGGIDENNDGEYSDAELVAYLGEDAAARRALLRDILARDLSQAEAAVLEAVATGAPLDEVNAALDGVAGASETWKQEVRDLLGRYNVGDIRVAMDGGSIDSGGDGIRAWFARQHDRNGSIAVTVAAGATVTGAEAGIYVSGAGDGLRIEKKYTSPAMQEENADAGADDLVTVEGYLDQVVRVQGTVTGGADAAVHLSGGGALIVTGAGKLVAGSSGRAVLVNDPGPAVIFIEGEVTGGAGPEGAPSPAAVHLTGGGSVTVGLAGRVRAGGAMSAIRGDNAATAVIVHTESTVRTLTQEQARADLARIDGLIVGDAVEDVIIAEVDADGTTGSVTPLLPVFQQGEMRGLVDVSGLPRSEFSCDMASDDRCRLYEALPSVLLAMNTLPTYGERLAAARSETGGWARVETSRGEWQADDSTRVDVGYDHARTGVRAGVDVAVGDNALLGVSVHGLQGEAEMSRSGGKAELSGMGLGMSATMMAGDVYIDAQAQATWFDVEVTSGQAGVGKLKDGVGGEGYALALEAGRAIALNQDLSLTPSIGLAWSQVSLDTFTDARGSGARVSMEDADSLVARLGVAAAASTGGGLRLFGSVDAMEEFSEESEARVSGTQLKSSAETTSVRLGLGAVHSWGEGRYAVQGSASYTAGGGDNSAFGGGLSLSLSF